MMRTKIALLLSSALNISLIAQARYFYLRLPSRVASHFNESGIPDGWSDKDSFFSFLLGVFIFTNLSSLIPIFVIRDERIKLPNKDFWMSKERVDDTMDFLSAFMVWFLNFILIFLLFQLHSVYRFNLDASPMPSIVYSVVSFVVAVIALIGFSVWRFARKPTNI
jgi:uncharacterized membrane protein